MNRERKKRQGDRPREIDTMTKRSDIVWEVHLLRLCCSFLERLEKIFLLLSFFVKFGEVVVFLSQ